MTSTTRSVLIGATLAVVLVAGIVGALVVRGGGVGAIGKRTAPDKVVVVFAMQDENKTVVAQMVSVVNAATGVSKRVDTSSTVSIPGTSYTALRDAYPFGGAKAVATALDDGTLKPGTAWVGVTPEAWKRLLKAGVEVTITEKFETFDQVTKRYSVFPDGPQRVQPVDLWGLVNGVAYLTASERGTIMDTVAAASLRELSASATAQGITTDLTPEQWSAFTKALRSK